MLPSRRYPKFFIPLPLPESLLHPIFTARYRPQTRCFTPEAQVKRGKARGRDGHMVQLKEEEKGK